MEEAEEIYEKKQVDTESIKCSSCGSNMVYDPKTGMLLCEHCGRKESFKQDLKAQELNIEQGFQDMKTWKEETVVFRCENCGAKVVLDKSETAKICPFCGTAHVVESKEISGIKPNALLPFSLCKSDALEYLKKWTKKKWLAPVGFSKSIIEENVNGIYCPCFTFDSNTDSRYAGRIGKRHTRTVGSGKNRRTETYIVWRNISGNLSHFFDDITITAGEKITQKNLDKLAPFDTNNSKEYEKKFLLGFMAYHYDKDISTSWKEAKVTIDKEIKKLILSNYSYDVVDYLNVSTSHSDVKYKYVLIPVYIGNYTFRKKLFGFLVNGTNGKVIGKAPVSIWKSVLLAVIGIGILALAVWFLNTYA